MSPLTLARHYQRRRLLYMLILFNALTNQYNTDDFSHTTAGFDYQLITTVSCTKHGTFYCHLSLLDQLLIRLMQATKNSCIGLGQFFCGLF